MTVATFLLVLGGVLVLGFAGQELVRRTGVPDVLLLISFGLILGPVLGLIDPEVFVRVSPYFGAIALTLILFEGGLELDARGALLHAPRAGLLVFLCFFASFGLVALVYRYGGGGSWTNALLLGAILANTSAPIVIPTIARLPVSPATRTIINLEASVGDALSVLFVDAILQHARAAEAVDSGIPVLPEVLRAFLIAVPAGLAVGILWRVVMERARAREQAYAATIAVVFLLQGVVEGTGGSGALAALLFGLALANADNLAPLARALRIVPNDTVEERVRRFHGEAVFIVRTFFFVYLGAITLIRGDLVTLFGEGLVLLAAIVGVRWAAVKIVSAIGGKEFESLAIASMISRGLTTAVLAFLPVQAGLVGTERFPEYAFAVIVGSNVLMTIGGAWVARRRGAAPAATTCGSDLDSDARAAAALASDTER